MRRFVPEICGVERGSHEKRVGQKFRIRLGAKFLGDQIFTVDSKPLKPSNIWQNLVDLDSAAFVWEAGQRWTMLNSHRVGQYDRTDLSHFCDKGHIKEVNFYGTHCRLTFWFVDAFP